jgi:hypothetical protein
MQSTSGLLRASMWNGAWLTPVRALGETRLLDHARIGHEY